MTSKERLLRAINHKEPDKVPIAPRMWNFLNRRGRTQNASMKNILIDVTVEKNALERLKSIPGANVKVEG